MTRKPQHKTHKRASNFTPASPQQMAMYGHVAALIRHHMERLKLSPGDLNEAMGNGRDQSGPFNWINAKGAPGPDNRAKLAKLFGVSEQALMRGKIDGPVDVTTAHNNAVALASRAAMPPAAPTRQPDILTFSVGSDGTSRLRLDVTMPSAKGVSLLQMVLSAGMVLTAHDESGG